MNCGTQHPIDGFGRLYDPAPVSEEEDDDDVCILYEVIHLFETERLRVFSRIFRVGLEGVP